MGPENRAVHIGPPPVHIRHRRGQWSGGAPRALASRATGPSPRVSARGTMAPERSWKIRVNFGGGEGFLPSAMPDTVETAVSQGEEGGRPSMSQILLCSPGPGRTFPRRPRVHPCPFPCRPGAFPREGYQGSKPSKATTGTLRDSRFVHDFERDRTRRRVHSAPVRAPRKEASAQVWTPAEGDVPMPDLSHQASSPSFQWNCAPL
jgi:hypothetical protein